jgi:hypothetical protein
MTHTSRVLQRTSTFRTTKKRYTDSYNNNSTVEYLTYSEIAWEISNVTPKVGVGAINWRYPKSVDSFLLKGLWFLCGCTMGEIRLLSPQTWDGIRTGSCGHLCLSPDRIFSSFFASSSCISSLSLSAESSAAAPLTGG